MKAEEIERSVRRGPARQSQRAEGVNVSNAVQTVAGQHRRGKATARVAKGPGAGQDLAARARDAAATEVGTQKDGYGREDREDEGGANRKRFRLRGRKPPSHDSIGRQGCWVTRDEDSPAPEERAGGAGWRRWGWSPATRCRRQWSFGLSARFDIAKYKRYIRRRTKFMAHDEIRRAYRGHRANSGDATVVGAQALARG